MARKKVVRTSTDVEIDRRQWNDKTLVLLEDRSRNMMKPDGTSYQYILGIETLSDKGNPRLHSKRYITDLCARNGWESGKDAARSMFLEPDKYPEILGEEWGN